MNLQVQTSNTNCCCFLRWRWTGPRGRRRRRQWGWRLLTSKRGVWGRCCGPRRRPADELEKVALVAGGLCTAAESGREKRRAASSGNEQQDSSGRRMSCSSSQRPARTRGMGRSRRRCRRKQAVTLSPTVEKMVDGGRRWHGSDRRSGTTAS
jgi:hypothetical protein